jgi:hypothetical protein
VTQVGGIPNRCPVFDTKYLTSLHETFRKIHANRKYNSLSCVLTQLRETNTGKRAI